MREFLHRRFALLDVLMGLLVLTFAVLILCGGARADNPLRSIKLPAGAIATDAACSDWTPWADTSGARVWRANAFTTVVLDSGTRRVRGDVTWQGCPELYSLINFKCAPEFGVGIGNPFQGEPLPAPAAPASGS